MSNDFLDSFSVIIESENLASCDVNEIEKMFDSLLNQTMSITNACEVIIGDNGLIPAQVLERVEQFLPNLKVVTLDRETTYYQAKNILGSQARGEIIIFCDSDCVYERHWIETILSSFRGNPNIDIVAGETIIDVQGFYSFAMAINYMLHRGSSSEKLVPSNFYFINNVAFKKQFFLENPLPCDLKIFRGICSVHSRLIRAAGHTIWRNSKARVFHLPPQSLKYYFIRYLLMGHDNYWLDRYLSAPLPKTAKSPETSTSDKPEDLTPKIETINSKSSYKKRSILQRIQNRFSYFKNQINIYRKEYDIPTNDFILAMPIIVLSQFLVNLGRLITQFNSLFSKEPHWLYDRLAKLLD